MGHIDDEICSDQVSDFSHACVVDQTAVRRSTSHEAFGPVHESVGFEHVVVNDTSLEVDSVREGLEVGRYCRDP